MLQIIKRKDVKGYEAFISELGFDPFFAEISEAVENDAVTGYAIYNLTPEALFIHKVEANGDTVLYDGIVRSILFLAALKGVERAVFDECERLNASALGFISFDSNILDPISKVLGSCSGCGHNC